MLNVSPATSHHESLAINLNLPQQTDQKRRLRDGLDILATKNMELSDVSSPWNIMHGTGTSELEDLKLAVRQDSTPPQDYWVGFFEHRGRRQSIIQPVLIQASFSTIPDSAPIVHELRQALAVQMLVGKPNTLTSR